MKYQVKCGSETFEIQFSVLNSSVFNRFFKGKFKRLKRDWREALTLLNFTPSNCNFCKRPNYNLSFDFSVNVSEIIVTSAGYADYENKAYCRSRDCLGKSLNANSKEFVALMYNLSDDDALKHLHKRNSSPFYKSSFATDAEHSKSQSNFGKLQTKESVALANYHKSLEYYILKYGEVNGRRLHAEYNKKKGVTLENMISLHGERGYAVYSNWKKYVKNSLDNFILRHGEEIGRERYKNYCAAQSEHLSNYRSNWGIASYTQKGELLRSNLELHFYNCMKMFDLHNENYSIEKTYPNSPLRSDFYFYDLDEYVEICGMMKIPEYKEKMLLKSREFGSILLETKEEMYAYCKNAKERIDEHLTRKTV